MLAQGTAARFKFTFHPYYCWSRLSTSCLLHEIGKRHITRYCWPWCFRARRGRYDSFPRGWAVIALRPYWLRCVSAPRSSFVIRRPLSALAKDFCYRHDLRSRSSGAPFRTLRKFRYATLGPSGCRTLCVFPFCKGCVFRSNTYKNFRSRAPVKLERVPHLFALYENSVTPRFALQGAALFAFFLSAKGACLDPTPTKTFAREHQLNPG